ncbi:AAA family ATPase [Helcococcus kunzii]|uniref:AAA family ATPase n=1 Tax=Helcococcus kunzii TaxID=40091 RepID=UPI0024ADCD0E|nr:DUF2813 domain-containing protein [Helcococcus kunzii]
MKLKNLDIKNFKGIKNLSIDFTEKTQIQGANATGKTTIFDAYSWLLWDKDSLNKKDFNIKPLNEKGNTTQGLESTVSGVFEIEGKELYLSKTYKEVWTKKRGQLQETFTGHTTDYFINEVPVKKSEYNNKISEFIEEKEFNLLSNPLYFNQILDKKERREILFSLIDQVEKEDLIKANKELKELDLDNYSVEELRAMAKASSKKINDEIKSIPARIDELDNSKNDFDFKELEKEKKSIESKLDKIDEQLADTTKLAENISELNSRINELESKKRDIKNANEDEYRKRQEAIDSKFFEIKNKFNQTKNELESKINSLKTETTNYYRDLKHKQNEKDRVNDLIQELRNKWIELNNSKFDGSFICPTCQREFEEHKKEEILEHFNLNKSKELSRITEKATDLKDELASINEFISKLNEYISKYENETIKLTNELKEIGEFKEEKVIAEKKDISSEINDLDEEIEAIKQALEHFSSGDNSKLLEDKKELRNKLDEVISALGQKDNNSKIDIRINELKDKEKTLTTKYEEQQYILYLCDEYTKTYTSLIQDKVNDLFEFVSFKLFDTQVNGSIIETAEVTVNGVPYSDVNNAGKINAGLDVINTLSKKLGKDVPIFVDNAESVNKLRDTKAQIVELIVSEDKELKIEGE